MKDFSKNEMEEMTKIVAGKTIESARVDDEYVDEFLVFMFTDGTELKIRYDWIYEYDLTIASTRLRSVDRRRLSKC